MGENTRGLSGTNIVQPDWFKENIARQGRQKQFDCQNARISYQHWEQPEKPGLLLVHGHAAHAHWWDFIAPSLTDCYDVAAIDLSGSGDSDHRAQYSARGFAEEIIQCIDDAGLDDPIVIGHSFGGTMTRVSAHLHAPRLTGIILVDSMISFRQGDRTPPPMPRQKERFYETLAEGQRRFRLRPPQACENRYLIDYIAAHSLRATPRGFKFKLDSAVFAKMLPDDTLPVAAEMIKKLPIPVGLIYGKQSRFFPPQVVSQLNELFEPALITGIDDAHHHVFLDQPEAFTHVLIQMLSDMARK